MWTQQQDGGISWRHRVPAGNALTSLKGIQKKINGIRDVYRNNSSNFETKLMRLSEGMHNFITEIIDVLQQFTEGYYFVAVTAERSQKLVID